MATGRDGKTYADGPRPGKCFPIQHVHSPKFRVSGPPRDLVGVRDFGQILRDGGHPEQIRVARALDERDRRKFAAGHTERPLPETEMYPPEIEMPINQKADWYVLKGRKAAENGQNDVAYRYFSVAADKFKRAGKYADMRRWEEVATSNLRTWRNIHAAKALRQTLAAR